MTMTINLPWFPAEVRPNARHHWAKVAEAKKLYRTACWALTREAVGIPDMHETGDIHLVIEFFPPSRRAYDLDNCLAAFKAGLDGIADGLKVNDKRFTLTIAMRPEVRGMIRVTVDTKGDKT